MSQQVAIVGFLTAVILGQQGHAIKLGAVTYWENREILSQFSQAPSDSIGIINPDSGILKPGSIDMTSNIIAAFKTLIANLETKTGHSARNFLGYVPTGYFNHSCDINGECQTGVRIKNQVETYFKEFPNLGGIFFDEVSPYQTIKNPNYQSELQNLRKLVKERLVAYNPGWNDPKLNAHVKPGEIVVTFEQNFTSNKNTSMAGLKEKGIKTWFIAYGVKPEDLNKAFSGAEKAGYDYFYAADDNKYGLPITWANQISLVSNKLNNMDETIRKAWKFCLNLKLDVDYSLS